MIDIYDFIQATKAHDLLSTLEQRHTEKLLGLAREVRFSPGELIHRDGDKSEFLYFILEGKVSLEVFAQEQCLPVQILEAGDAAGWSCLMDGGVADGFQVRCLELVRALAFEAAQLRAACESDPNFGYRMTRLALGLAGACLDAARTRLVEQACRRTRWVV